MSTDVSGTRREEVAREDTVAFVQKWLMNADYDPTQFDRDFAAAIDERAPTQVDERGEAMVCIGCGTTRTVAAIRASSPTAFTCCPKRKMVPVRDIWRVTLSDRERAPVQVDQQRIGMAVWNVLKREGYGDDSALSLADRIAGEVAALSPAPSALSVPEEEQ